jgi:hypothetical protein
MGWMQAYPTPQQALWGKMEIGNGKKKKHTEHAVAPAGIKNQILGHPAYSLRLYRLSYRSC